VALPAEVSYFKAKPYQPPQRHNRGGSQVKHVGGEIVGYLHDLCALAMTTKPVPRRRNAAFQRTS
jgi:hypothetical protein